MCTVFTSIFFPIDTFTNMGGELKEVGKALGDVGKDSLKSLASQSVQGEKIEVIRTG